jgi:hypothetical protein
MNYRCMWLGSSCHARYVTWDHASKAKRSTYCVKCTD